MKLGSMSLFMMYSSSMKKWAKVKNRHPQMMNNWSSVNSLSLDCYWKNEAPANQGEKMTEQQDMPPATAQENNSPMFQSTHDRVRRERRHLHQLWFPWLKNSWASTPWPLGTKTMKYYCADCRVVYIHR